MPLLSTFGAASARGFGNLSGIAIPVDDLFNTVSFLSHFDGSNNGVNNVFDDSSSSNHTITASGNVTQGSFGPFAKSDGNWGVSFDGSGDYLSVPDSSDFDLGSGDFTAECWVFPTSSVNQPFIMGQWAGSYSWAIQFSNNSSRFLRFLTNISGISDNVATTPTPLNQWSHIALVRNGNSFVGYLNGVSVVSNTISGALPNSTNPFNIGAIEGGSQPYQGSISNLRLVKGTALYTSNFTPSTSPLTAVTNTKLLTCQSNRFVDNSTSAHTITASGDAAVSAFGPFLTSEVYDAAVNGASAYFDGTIDELNTPNTSDFGFGTGAFTWEAWIYALDTTGVNSPYIFDFRAGGNTNNGSFYINNTNSGRLEYYGNGVIQGNTAVPLNEWVHVACVRSGTTIKLYQAGVEVGSVTNSSNLGSSGQLVVGDYIINNNNNFKGYICDVRIDKGTAIYTSAFTPPTAPLTAVTNTKLLLNMADGQAIDSAAQHNLALYGDAKVSNTQAKFGDTSIYFDGTGDYAVVEDFTQLTGELTIEFWVNPSALSPKNGFFQQGFADGGLSIRAETSGSLTVAKTNVSS